MRVDPVISQHAGIASKKGLILVLSWDYWAAAPPGDSGTPSSTFFAGDPYRAILIKYTPRHVNSPMNIFAH